MEVSMEVQSQNFALKTLIERCHILENQMKAVDEENLKLKVQIANKEAATNGIQPDPNVLLSDIEVLKKQKEQLSNQIHVLATENNNMWSRLSKLEVVNRKLTRRFSKISATLDEHGVQNKSSESDCGTFDSKEYQATLEDMSSKLINSIKLEKTELESQYAQMVALHRNDELVTGQELAYFSIDGDEDSVSAGIRKHSQKLTQIKQALLQQQAMLVSSLENLKKLKNKEQSETSSNQIATKDAATEPIVEVVRAVPIIPTVELSRNTQLDVPTGNNEQICPICGEHIPDNIENFVTHVTDCLTESEEYELVDPLVQIQR